MRLDVRPVDLRRRCIEAALDAVRPAAAAKAIRLADRCSTPGRGAISGDPARLQQVVWNLLMNAVKFTPKGGRVQVHLQRVNSHVEIVVSDTGQGIAPDLLPRHLRAFPPGGQLEHAGRTAGSGIGLALVRHLVELHGGSVSAQSAGEGQGATFIVRLPVSLAEIAAGTAARLHPTAVETEALAAGLRLDGLRVLVVDDDLDCARAGVARSSSGAGAEVQGVSLRARRARDAAGVASRRARVGHRDAGRGRATR